MKRIYSILKLLFQINIREPLSFVWNLAFPCLLFFVFNINKTHQSLTGISVLQLLIPFSSYIIFSSCTFGVGLVVLTWRENGFFQTFIQNRKSILLFVTAQIFLLTFLNVIFTTFLFFEAVIMFGANDFSHLTEFLLMNFFLSIIFSFASLAINTLNLKSSTINTLLSIAMFPLFLSGSLHSLQNPWMKNFLPS